MTGHSKLNCLQEPAALPFLPLLYVAWADSDLSPEELGEISAQLAATETLDEGCRAMLSLWLDPATPPTSKELLALLSNVRQAATGLDLSSRGSLRDLGAGLATRRGEALEPSVRRALTVIEQVLGVEGEAVGPRLLGTARPQPARGVSAPSFRPRRLARFLHRRRPGVREAVLRVLERESMARRTDLDREAYREQVLEWCRELAAEGLGGLAFPRELGGADDMDAAIVVFETLAYHDLSLLVKFGVQFGLFGGSIQQLGTEPHHRAHLPAVGRLDLPGCFAMTETGHGSNVHDLETTARYDPATDELIVHTPSPEARKDYIGNAARHGRLATVFAQLEVGSEHHGVHAVLVPIRDESGRACPGVSIEDCGAKLGLEGVDNGRIAFDQVRVPRANLLNRFGAISEAGVYSSPIASADRRFFTMLGTLVAGRVSVAWGALSATKVALTIAVRYAARRRQFGPEGEAETLLLDYQTHQLRLFPRLATTFAVQFGLEHLSERYLASDEASRRDVEVLAAGLKAYATRHATDTIQTCREACGGQGYLRLNRFADLKADTDVFATFEGDNTVLLQLVAKGLLTGYKRQFADLNLLGLARFVAARAAAAVAELNPLVTRQTDRAHLRDGEFHLAALRWREQHQLAGVAGRIKKRLDRGQEIAHAFVECQSHLVETARAHVERILLEQFRAALGTVGDPNLAAVLEKLATLFALARIERDRGWFLEHGYLEPAKAKAIRKEVRFLAGELQREAVGLVDGFGIPEWLLGAPIAGRVAPGPD